MGHASGDILLKLFAQRLKSTLREYDAIARIGGDEFVILTDNLQANDDCRIIAERLIAAMSKPFHINERDVTIQSSIGISIYPDDATNADELLSTADTAMYKSKKDKSVKYFFYSKS